MKKLFLLLALVLTSLLGAQDNAFAEGNAMQISPVVNSFSIKAGDVQNYTFSIENTGTEKYSYKLYVIPYNVSDEDYTNDFSKETAYNQITRWVTFQDQSGSFVANPVFSIEPGEKQVIVYRVTVPDDIPDGGQYGIIMAETVKDDSSGSEELSMNIETASRVGLYLLGHGSGETNGTAEIVDYKLTGMFTSSNISASATVKNNGNTDFTAKYKLLVKSIFGKTLYTNEEGFAVLPETQRKFSTEWTDAPLFGIFNVNYEVTALDASQSETHIILILPIFVIVIMVLLLTSIIIWSIILLRKRKERSSRLVV
ncbi:hypothetical protein IJH66_01335 [Candidatus Saccharibacteria bacterium]|nr:hypothetical protein [Candidatus Saccharibacteria bacterium]MBQ6147784.1 hypothetical protein [Candidatus Saccharibacteria bacterium]MBQ6605606.1 hypothetical protein [Candidatus Saccharibacteria bacterium]